MPSFILIIVKRISLQHRFVNSPNGIRAVIDEEPTQQPDGSFSFNFDFGEGDELVTIELVPKYYNPESSSSFFESAKAIPESERYVLPEQVGMILGFQSHFTNVEQADVDKLVHGGIVLNNRGFSVVMNFTQSDYEQMDTEGATPEFLDRKYAEAGFDRISLDSEGSLNYTFIRKK